MRRVILGVSLIAITPVAFIFALVFFLAVYHQRHAALLLSQKNQNKVIYAALPPYSSNISTEIIELDGRTEKIRQFMEKYNSPLEPYAQDFIEAADKYGLDYRLLPAIAMQESNLCRVIPINSNNCWGFGIYGGKVTRFDDYKEAIYTISKTLATKYADKGLITPEQIMTIWTPSSNGSWAYSVNHFMDKLK